MRASKLSLALGGLAAWAFAGVAYAAPGDAWSPKSSVFQVNYRFATIALLLLAGGIAFGLFATNLFRVRRARINKATGDVQRHTVGHILTHWMNAIGFLLATFTGAVMLKWLPITISKPMLYTLHYIGAGAILIGFVGTVVNALTKGTTQKHRLIPTGHQVHETFLEVLAYAGLVGQNGILGFRGVQWPASLRREIEKGVGFKGIGREGKYLAAEEVLSYPLWALIGLLIISSGILKAARYAYPLPHAVVQTVTVIHDWTAVGTVVMLVLHIAPLVLVKTNWPLFTSMFNGGKVRVDYVKNVHGKWYDELLHEGQADVAPIIKPAPVVDPAAAGAEQGD